ncbi:hypothetical protein BT63DRAFT_39800 [Microthyrium microscopicum]|uniref:Uncharacterized protein n=1 Tax=Microthyrium microscopicum TaxID=703497 RepID=A0A6A6UVN3_9PEZI|nr:hypothetical protein BT63DRAFT_39800 [Microthyrium microscopicum]
MYPSIILASLAAIAGVHAAIALPLESACTPIGTSTTLEPHYVTSASPESTSKSHLIISYPTVIPAGSVSKPSVTTSSAIPTTTNPSNQFTYDSNPLCDICDSYCQVCTNGLCPSHHKHPSREIIRSPCQEYCEIQTCLNGNGGNQWVSFQEFSMVFAKFLFADVTISAV